MSLSRLLNTTVIFSVSVLGALCLIAPEQAQAGPSWKYSVLFGANTSRPRDAENTYQPSLGFNAGVMMDKAVQTWGADHTKTIFFIELGAQFNVNRYRASADDSLTYEFTSKTLQFPVQVRLWVLSWLSLGGGGYYTRMLGDLVYQSPTSGVLTSTYTKPYDAGLIVSVKMAFRVGGTWIRGFVEPRYTYGMLDVVSGGQARYESIDFLFGLRFGGVRN